LAVKANNLISLAAVVGICVGLYACGGGNGYSGMPQQPGQPMQPMQPMQPTTMMLNVNDVLMKAKVQSDTDDPFDVNGGVITLTPSNDDESDPMSVN
jgi:hypothetical protein